MSLFAVYRLFPHVWVCSQDRPRCGGGGVGGGSKGEIAARVELFFYGLSGWQNDLIGKNGLMSEGQSCSMEA